MVQGATASTDFSIARLNARLSALSSWFTVCRAAPAASRAAAYSSSRTGVTAVTRVGGGKNASMCAQHCCTRSFERSPSRSYCRSCSQRSPPTSWSLPSASFVYSASTTRSGRPMSVPLSRLPMRSRSFFCASFFTVVSLDSRWRCPRTL